MPPGFRFSPTDVELIDYYLKKKITGNDEEIRFIREDNFFERDPGEFPGDQFRLAVLPSA
jgi:hypothetical protein